MKLIVTSSTFPAHERDHAPSFVLDQVRALYELDETLEIHVLIPHNSYLDETIDNVVKKSTHTEIRYHYALPHSLEKLTGRGILPALKENPLRYVLIPGLLLAQYFALKRLIRQVKPDAVYAHWFMPQGIIAYFACKPSGIPLLFTTHASDVSVLKKVPGAKKLIAKVLAYTPEFTAVSKRTATKLTSFFTDAEWRDRFAQKLSIIPMGVDLQHSTLPPKTASALLSEAGVKNDRKMILAIGRLSHKKGFKYLIEGYAKLDKSVKDSYQLVIGGDGQLMDELRQAARTNGVEGDVVFPGYVSGDLKHALLESADIFVLPSIIDDQGDSEGLPVALMEALSYGKMVIATTVSGAEEVLTQNAGTLIEQKSPEAIAKAITKLTALPASKVTDLRTNAKQLAEQFDWHEVARKHMELIKRIAIKD